LLWNNTSTHQVNCRYRQGINREFRWCSFWLVLLFLMKKNAI
jgi:hypothetical protein